MSAIITAVFKATIGLLVNKGRDKVAETLKDGDVTDQQFRGLIVREIDEIKSKLDGLSRKDLLASISFFKEGIELLYETFDIIRSRSEHGAACAEGMSIIEGMRNLELADLDESVARKLANAKKRFKRARERATDAYSNEGLTTSDRILAMQYRVIATILETINNPADAIAPCKVCVEELNCLPAVQSSFEVQRKTGIMAAVSGLFNKEERRKIISGVCHVNRVMYDVQTALGKGPLELEWPTVDTGEEKVDPLRDGIVTEALCKQGMEHCCVSWSFGQEGENEHGELVVIYRNWRSIATNSSGQFIVGDSANDSVKVFDSSGKFLTHFTLTTDSRLAEICDVATDMNDNIFVLTNPRGPETQRSIWIKFKSADLQHKFLLRKVVEEHEEHWYRNKLSVSDTGKVVVLRHPEGNCAVEIYETDGQFVCSFGEKLFNLPEDITTVSDGRVMVAEDRYVHIFSENGDHLNTFDLQSFLFPNIAFHRASERVVVTGVEREKELVHVQIHSKDGEFVRSTQIHVKGILWVRGMTVTTEGRIVGIVRVLGRCNDEVLVI